jgi:hypothetical protein
VKISLDSEERRQAHARAYWAWAKDNPTSALARFGGKPPAMFGQPAVGKKPRPGPRKTRRKRTFRATKAQHAAFMRRLYGSKGRP